MQNQDPLNPMDNAQITSQMAQINTVTGLEKLNTGAGRWARSSCRCRPAGRLRWSAATSRWPATGSPCSDGVGRRFAGSPARRNVKVEMLRRRRQGGGHHRPGPQDAGRHGFDWMRQAQRRPSGYTFRVVGHAAARRPWGRTADARPRAVVSARQHLVTLPGAQRLSVGQPTSPSTDSPPTARQGFTMSFQQGLSGLNATSKNLEVIGNNIANANTYGPSPRAPSSPTSTPRR
jgi:hypothetical protein